MLLPICRLFSSDRHPGGTPGLARSRAGISPWFAGRHSGLLISIPFQGNHFIDGAYLQHAIANNVLFYIPSVPSARIRHGIY